MLKFQVAGTPGGYLLEHLLLESIGAIRGGGIFAWVNLAGAKSLFDDDIFQEFLKTGEFRLLIGTDTITDTPAIERLIQISTRQPGLTARAFLSPTSSLFHPKLAWFQHDDHVSLIVGSGNLTMGGLRSNWEAFMVEHLTGQAAREVLHEIDSFITDQGPHLAQLNDQRVLDRVKENTGNERNLRKVPMQPPTPGDLQQEVEEVLVADMNRTQSRLAQANFKVKDYEDFFGAQRGTQRRVSLRLIGTDGSVGDIQSRPSVEAKSKNYRFELDGLKMAHLESAGRPIGVFLRLSTGEFLYSLVRPEDPGFEELDAMLTENSTERANHLRRIRITGEEFSDTWPTAPVLRTTLPAL